MEINTRKNFSVKAFFLALLFLFPVSPSAAKHTAPESAIRLYAYYSPSHKQFFTQWFQPSIKDTYELVVRQFDQVCPGGAFKAEGWDKAMLQKIDMILEAIDQNQDRPYFIYADVDIQFFEKTWPIIDPLMQKFDLVVQKNNSLGEICAGFFACRANKKTKKLFEAVRAYMINTKDADDQTPLNMFLRKHNTFGINWSYLPDTFMTGWTFLTTNRIPFVGGPYIPDKIVLHHANWCKGIKKKIAQLNVVKTQVYKVRTKEKRNFDDKLTRIRSALSKLPTIFSHYQ